MVTVDPLYVRQDYSDAEGFKFEKMGSKVYGTITKVGEPRKLTNKKYDPDKDPEYKATYTAQFIEILTAEGKAYSIMLSGAQFGAVGEALEAAEQSTLKGLEGWGFGMKWEDVKSGQHGMAKVWKARLDTPQD